MSWTSRSRRHARLVELLVETRREAGISQVELARRMGLRQQWIAHMESGARRIDVVELIDICRALDCDCVELFRKICRVRD